MKRTFLGGALLLVLFATACAPAVPTVDPAMVQASAMAAASTMIAMTQAAIPTATETPVPSPTPLPSPTIPPLPTSLPATIEPTRDPSSCNQLLDVAASGGKKATLKINNLTKGPITVSIGLSTMNAFGQCGYLSWVLGSKESTIVNPPQTGPGPCYWTYAWVNDPKNPSVPGGAPPLCMNSTDKYELDIDYETMRITPP
jgi:hypothetical protein